MGIFDKKNIIKIDAEDVKDAKLSSSGFSEGNLKQRAFADVLGARLAMKSLFSQKIEANNFYSLYSIHSVLKELDIADIYFQGIKIDVRLVFNPDEIFIPKSHFEYDLLPDVYVVLQLKEDFSSAEFLGYFEPQDINKENANKDYYFYEYDKLHKPQDLKDFLESFIVEDNFKSTEEDTQKAEDLFLEFVDKEISQQDKLFLFKQLANNISLREKIVELENFELMSTQVATRPDLLQDQFLDVIGAQQVVEKEPLTKTEFNSELAAAGVIAVAGATAGAAGAAAGIAGVMAAANAKSILPDIGSVNISPEINFGNDASEELSLDDIKEDPEEDELNDLFSEFETEKETENIENEVSLDDIDLDAFTSDEETKNDDENEDELDDLDELVDLEDLEEVDKTEDKEEAIEAVVEDEELTALDELTDNEENDATNDDEVDETDCEQKLEDEITDELGTLEELPPLEELDEVQSFDEIEDQETEDETKNSDEDEDEDKDEIEAENADDDSNLTDFNTLAEESKITSEEIPNEFDDNVVSFDEMIAQDEPKKDKDALEKFNELEAEEEAEEIASATATSKDDSDEFISQVDDFLNDIELSDEQKSLVEDELGSNIDLDDILSELPETNSESKPFETAPMETVTTEAEVNNETAVQSEETTNKDSAKDSDLLQVLFKNENNEATAQTDLTQADFAKETITEGDFGNIDFTKGSSPFSNLAKNKKMIIAASVATVVLAAVVVGGITKQSNKANDLNKPPAVEQAANPQDPNSDITSQVPEQTQAQPGEEGQLAAPEQPSIPGETQATAPKRDMNKAVSDAFLSEPVNATISKVAWEVPEDLAYNDSFRKYLQMAGKNLKLNLQNELLLATEMAYSNKVVVDMEVSKDGDVQSSNVTISSGSKQIDKIVLQSVKETLKYLKMPADELNRPSIPVTLIINF